jgi:hypothetical protein
MSNRYQKFDIHDWKPWQRSTGAKTLEGKQASKMNALKHGYYTKEAIAERKQLAEIKRLLKKLFS